MKQSAKRIFGTKLAVACVAAGSLALSVAALPVSVGATGAPTSLKVTTNATWGSTLTLKSGVTVYRLSTDKKNKSLCTGACAKAWPPVLLATGQTKAVGVGVSGLGSIPRAGGLRQVTLDGIPLYTFIGDKGAGKVTGNVTDTWGKWFSINPKSPTVAPKKKSSGGTGATTTTAPGSGIAY